MYIQHRLCETMMLCQRSPFSHIWGKYSKTVSSERSRQTREFSMKETDIQEAAEAYLKEAAASAALAAATLQSKAQNDSPWHHRKSKQAGQFSCMNESQLVRQTLAQYWNNKQNSSASRLDSKCGHSAVATSCESKFVGGDYSTIKGKKVRDAADNKGNTDGQWNRKKCYRTSAPLGKPIGTIIAKEGKEAVRIRNAVCYNESAPMGASQSEGNHSVMAGSPDLTLTNNLQHLNHSSDYNHRWILNGYGGIEVNRQCGALRREERENGALRKEEDKIIGRAAARSRDLTPANNVLVNNGRTNCHRWMLNGHGAPVMNMQRGEFSKQESEEVRQSVEAYCNAKQISVRRLCSECDHKGDLQGAWTEIAKSLPKRTVQSVYLHGIRRCHPFKRGPWTEVECVKLRDLVTRLGPKWRLIQAELNRSGESCRDKCRTAKWWTTLPFTRERRKKRDASELNSTLQKHPDQGRQKLFKQSGPSEERRDDAYPLGYFQQPHGGMQLLLALQTP